MRKNFGLTKYPGEKILDHGNTLEKKNLNPRKRNGTTARDRQNLA